MRAYLLLAIFGLLVCAISARHGSISDHITDDDDDDDNGDEENPANDNNDPIAVERRRNPCIRKKCHRGETCELDRNLKPKCICTPDCGFASRARGRFMVCSNKNVTYNSECELDRDHCLCKRRKEGCSNPGIRKVQLDYYGQCQDQGSCSESEAVQFPSRMRDWLFVIMEEMASRALLGEYTDMLAQAENDEFHSYAVIWKFCDLDQDPQNRKVSRRELQFTVRSLRAMEHCLLPFLDDCDADDNRDITLQEWGQCLGLEQDKIVDKCTTIHKHRKGRK